MSGDRLLLDTFFVQALLNRRDQYHKQAIAWLPRVRSAPEIWVTEAVLVEAALRRARERTLLPLASRSTTAPIRAVSGCWTG
jgi:predicted nucleic acid-binding protein